MTAIATPRVKTRSRDGKQFVRKMAPSKILAGTIVMLNSTGFATGGATATGQVADGVAMEITAADAKAAAMLRADEKLIVDAVRRTGLAGEIVAIHTADAPRAASQAHAGGDPAAQGNGQASAHANGGSAGGLTVLLHADFFASLLPETVAVAAIGDAGSPRQWRRPTALRVGE